METFPDRRILLAFFYLIRNDRLFPVLCQLNVKFLGELFPTDPDKAVSNSDFVASRSLSREYRKQLSIRYRSRYPYRIIGFAVRDSSYPTTRKQVPLSVFLRLTKQAGKSPDIIQRLQLSFSWNDLLVNDANVAGWITGKTY